MTDEELLMLARECGVPGAYPSSDAAEAIVAFGRAALAREHESERGEAALRANEAVR